MNAERLYGWLLHLYPREFRERFGNDMRELFNLATLVRPGTVGTFSQFRRDFLSGHDKRAPRNTPPPNTGTANAVLSELLRA